MKLKFFQPRVRGTNDMGHVAALGGRRNGRIPPIGDQGLIGPEFHDDFNASIPRVHMPGNMFVGVNLKRHRAEA